jgi:hemerythrin-like domain-containing protein
MVRGDESRPSWEREMLDATEKPQLFQRPPGEAAVRADPFVLLDYDHKAQRALADLLEQIADSLPDEVNRAAAALAAKQIRTLHARHARIEDECVFPLLESRCDAEVTRRAIAIARREHEDAEGRAIELAEELDALAATGRAINAEGLGFMLRAFFDALRRHLDWVDAAILPQAREKLSEGDRDRLAERLVTIAAGAGACGLAVIEGARG